MIKTNNRQDFYGVDKSTTVKKLSVYSSYIVAGVLILLPFHAFITVWLSSWVHHYTLIRLWKEFLLAILSLGVLYILYRDRALARKFFNSRLTQLIFFYILLSLIWGFSALSIHKVTAKALGYGLIVNLRFLIFFLATRVIANKSRLLQENWQRILLIPAGLVVVLGLVQRLFLPYDFLKHFGYSVSTIFPYETINHNIHYPRIMSTLRGSNPLGAYLILVISAAVTLFYKTRKWLWGLVGFGAVICLFLSYSRAAWIGIIASLLVLAWALVKNSKARRLLWAAFAAVAILGVILIVALRHNVTFENYFLHTQEHTTAKVSSNQGHISAFRNGIHDVVHEPLGRGIGTAGPASVYNGTKGRIAENYYIQIGQELGWVGLIIFLAINYLVAKQLWLRRADSLALILFASFIGLIAVNFFSHAWTDDTLAYIWWGLAGAALASSVSRKTQAV